MPTTLRLKAGVGTSRDSEPDDVLTLKKSLNRLGLYEPDPELGINQFVDRRLAMAIRRFQRSRGLLESGEVRPGDDTERAIDVALSAVDGKLARTGSAMTTGKRAARSASGLERAEPQSQEQSTRDEAGDAERGAQRPGAGLGGKSEGPKILPIPEYRRQVLEAQGSAWRAWSQAVGSLSGVSSAERRAYMEIFAAEGGNRRDPDSSAASGILQSTLDKAIERGVLRGAIKGVTKPHQLSLDERVAVYRNYFDDVLRTVDRSMAGSRVLSRIGDDEAAAAFADTLFRHGRAGGTRLIQEAINAVAPGTVQEDGRMGPATFDAFVRLAGLPKQRDALLNRLADARNRVTNNAERARMDHFRFQKAR